MQILRKGSLELLKIQNVILGIISWDFYSVAYCKTQFPYPFMTWLGILKVAILSVPFCTGAS